MPTGGEHSENDHQRDEDGGDAVDQPLNAAARALDFPQEVRQPVDGALGVWPDPHDDAALRDQRPPDDLVAVRVRTAIDSPVTSDSSTAAVPQVQTRQRELARRSGRRLRHRPTATPRRHPRAPIGAPSRLRPAGGELREPVQRASPDPVLIVVADRDGHHDDRRHVEVHSVCPNDGDDADRKADTAAIATAGPCSAGRPGG